MKSVFLSTLSLNTISVYFASLESLNFDETVDTVPTSDNQQPVPKADVDMRSDYKPKIEPSIKSKQDLSTSVYIAAPKDKPVGLNMGDFAMSDESPGDDLKILEDVGKDHEALVGIITRRAGSIKAILNYWQNGSIGSAINALNMINDPCVTMDVLNNTFSKNLRVEMLNFEYIVQLLPHT